MKKGQKTQKKLEFRLKNKENRQRAGLKSCFWALIGTNRDESAFLVVRRDIGFRSPNRDCPDEIGTVGKYGLSQRSKEGQDLDRLEVQVRGAWSGKARPSVPTSLERTDRVFPAVYFSQSAEGPHEHRRMASKNEQRFALFFVA